MVRHVTQLLWEMWFCSITFYQSLSHVLFFFVKKWCWLYPPTPNIIEPKKATIVPVGYGELLFNGSLFIKKDLSIIINENA
ncbi:hypothetical protein, partial [Ureibacillus thermosphaericus]|uniref:hypothetical protein n=1 Tax=Ureibacillus thermosphaericus TaxID=51173 RepID=UPI0030C95EC6